MSNIFWQRSQIYWSLVASYTSQNVSYLTSCIVVQIYVILKMWLLTAKHDLAFHIRRVGWAPLT